MTSSNRQAFQIEPLDLGKNKSKGTFGITTFKAKSKGSGE